MHQHYNFNNPVFITRADNHVGRPRTILDYAGVNDTAGKIVLNLNGAWYLSPRLADLALLSACAAQ